LPLKVEVAEDNISKICLKSATPVVFLGDLLDAFQHEGIGNLPARAKTFIVAGDIAGSRVLLQRATEANNAEAALMLGATYDPFVLRELKVVGVAADLATARNWYEKAKELGSPDAPRRLEILASAAR
jgi:TPR repeat protein